MRTIEIQLYKYTELEKYAQEIALAQFIATDEEYYGKMSEEEVLEEIVSDEYEFFYTGKMYDENNIDYLFEVW